MTDRFDIKGERHAAKVVAEFLAVTKTAEGMAYWVRDDGSEECRIGWPIAVDGLLTSATLSVTAYPFDEAHGFTITLNFPPCISRLDFVGPNEAHANPIEDFSRCDAIVYGPHVHLWQDNSRFCTASTLPRELECAIPVPLAVKRYEKAMFWFCDEVNIRFTQEQLLPLPPRNTLF
jgi:hypothetical protein